VEKPRPFSQDAAILRANESFYRAFSAGDYAAMERVWAAHAPVSCLHPGLPALVGRETVMQSWRQILAQSGQIVMRCDHARVQLFGESAVVTCYEGNGDEPAHLAATNVFVREGDEWRMVHHHAGPLARAIARPVARGGGGGGAGLN
jgi:ketosteroid isomerase-like protein